MAIEITDKAVDEVRRMMQKEGVALKTIKWKAE